MALKVNVINRRQGVFVVAPIGSIDTAGHSLFQEKVNAIVAQHPDVIIFDMEFTDYINSMGLRVLFAAQKALKTHSGKLVYMKLQPQIKKVFDILSALPSLKVFASIEELDGYLDAMQAQSTSRPTADE